MFRCLVRPSRRRAPIGVAASLLASLALLAACWFAAPAALARPALFEGPVRLLGGAPYAAVGDFDVDGHLDVAVVGRDTLPFVHRGLGARAFVSPPATAVALNRVQSPIVADVDGDGHADLVATVAELAAVRVYPGLAGGSFGPGLDTPIASSGVRVAASDVNGDGRADLACLGTHPARLSLLLSAPAGGWLPRVDQVLVETPTDVKFMRFDDDAIEDLLLTSIGGGLAWSRGLGSGSFAPPAALPFPTNEFPQAVHAANLDGDAHTDLIVPFTTNTFDGVALLRGTGDGGLASRDSVTGFGRIVGAGDVDQDGLTDLLAAGGNTIEVRYGDQGFSSPTARVVPAGLTWDMPRAIDMDADGRRDIVFSSPAGARIAYQNPDGSFGEARLGAMSTPLYALAVADFDGDGHLDVASQLDGGYGVRMGTGGGAFAPMSTYPNPPPGPTVHGVLVTAELTGDDVPDLVMASGGTLPVLRGLGDGTFQSMSGAVVSEGFRSLAFGDVDGDHDTDLVESTWFGSITGTTYSDIRTAHNDGTGTFTLAGAQFLTPELRWDRIVLADLDHDGRDDIVTATLEVLMALPNGLFALPRAVSSVPYGNRAVVVAVGLLTGGDANPDILFEYPDTYGYPGGLGVLPGVGNGYFGPPIATTAPLGWDAWPSSDSGPTIADLNGDGVPEVVYQSSTEPQAVRVLFVDGSGRFAEQHVYPLVDYVGGRVRVGDMNGDGRMDIVVAHPNSGVFEWLQNSLEPPVAGTPRAPVEPALVLEGATLAHGGSPLRFHVRLAGAAPSRLELLDVQGRVNQSLTLDARRGVSQVVTLNAPAVSGVWFARLRQGVATATRKVCVIR